MEDAFPGTFESLSAILRNGELLVLGMPKRTVMGRGQHRSRPSIKTLLLFKALTIGLQARPVGSSSGRQNHY